MPKRPSNHPTEAEMEILVLLWTRGPLTAREVQERLAMRRTTGYTTALKLLQMMYAKRLVKRDQSERAHRYTAAVSERVIQEEVVGTLVHQLFSGSVAQLVQRAVDSQRTSPEERAEIRRLLDARQPRQSPE